MWGDGDEIKCFFSAQNNRQPLHYCLPFLFFILNYTDPPEVDPSWPIKLETRSLDRVIPRIGFKNYTIDYKTALLGMSKTQPALTLHPHVFGCFHLSALLFGSNLILVINFIYIKYIYYLNKNIFLSLNYLKIVINFIHIKYIFYFKKLKLLFLPYFWPGR